MEPDPNYTHYWHTLLLHTFSLINSYGLQKFWATAIYCLSPLNYLQLKMSTKSFVKQGCSSNYNMVIIMHISLGDWSFSGRHTKYYTDLSFSLISVLLFLMLRRLLFKYPQNSSSKLIFTFSFVKPFLVRF